MVAAGTLTTRATALDPVTQTATPRQETRPPRLWNGGTRIESARHQQAMVQSDSDFVAPEHLPSVVAAAENLKLPDRMELRANNLVRKQGLTHEKAASLLKCKRESVSRALKRFDAKVNAWRMFAADHGLTADQTEALLGCQSS